VVTAIHKLRVATPVAALSMMPIGMTTPLLAWVGLPID